jgi:D-glycero-beta-D-manno-heptose 1-phosphate adenylyltransferase
MRRHDFWRLEELRWAVHEKVISRREVVSTLTPQRRQGQRVVFTNGCFDLMHVGHTRYLQAARDLGDLLVVGVNTDRSVRSLNKGSDRPIVPEQQRAEVLAALACVDYVVLFDEPDPGRLITEILPDVLVKGGDWTPDTIIGRETVEAHGGTVKTIPLVPGVSTTALLKKIRSSDVIR